MLEVVSLEDARLAVADRFKGLSADVCQVTLAEAAGRIIADDVIAREGVPSFDRSTVDGFALLATVEEALERCDMVLVSGGSSAG